MDDLMGLLDSDEKPSYQKQESRPQQSGGYNGGYNNGGSYAKKDPKVDLWNKTDFTPVKISASTFTHAKNTFSVIAYSPTGTIPAEVEERISEITKVLANKGYTYRYGSDGKDNFQKSLSETDSLKVETFLPWKKFNLEAKNIQLISPIEKAYGICFNYRRKYTDLPAPVRAINAKDIHILLGKDCTTPLEFLIVYSGCGSESLGEKIDFKVLGPLSLLLRIASESNIPVFNFKNEDAVKRLIELIKSKQTTN